MRKPRIRDRSFFGAYYKSKSPKIIWGAEQIHCYPCGTFVSDGEEYHLIFLRLSKEDLDVEVIHNEDSITLRAESFELSLSDADEIAKHPLFQLAAKGDPIEVTEDLMTQFDPTVSQLIQKDLEEGLSPYDIFNKRAALLVTQFMGFTFKDVITNHPEIYKEVESEGPDGELLISKNIWANSQEVV